ncbi:nuclease-related domain-containing protein [Saccharopolyspora gloriosae]|uniref:nuclease-related domain-containing protein n=1 Tax=Saccharopolyspora gloriosae TaxID=455344 RepID=UPI001FB70841|nr:nuclease-related domain-containing protein [Saccharopolyspora gloriosae]
MRVEVLSDHPRSAARRTEQAAEQRRSQYEQAVAQVRARNAARRWWEFWKLLPQWLETRRLREQRPVDQDQVRHRLAQQEAGIEAEDAMASALDRLSDDWTLFRGYRNGRGEVDHLVVGPGGVWAIEVKNHPGRVHVDGDSWRSEVFDRYGNRVEKRTLTDRSGRSWGRQVTDVSKALADFLQKRGRQALVRSVVVIVNPKAQLGTVRRPGLALVSVSPDEVVRTLRQAPPTLGPASADEVARLVRRDHAFHEKRRAQRNN